MQPSISVIVPVLNRAQIVLATLESVAGQTLLPQRLVVVDDGSTDETAKQVGDWLARRNGLFDGTLVRQPHRGRAAARNRGLRAAGTSATVAFLDPHDRWPSDFLERTFRLLSEFPPAVAASCDVEIHDQRGGRIPQEQAPLAAQPIVWIMAHGARIASSTLLRTSAIERRGGFDESLVCGEEAALFMRLSLDGRWLHAAGRPVLVNRDFEHADEGPQLASFKSHDRQRQTAEVYEDFILHGGGHRAVPPTIYRKLLATAWHRAGGELAREGRYADARDCYRLALGWNAWGCSTWLARSFLDIRDSWSRLFERSAERVEGPTLARFEDEQFEGLDVDRAIPPGRKAA